MKRLRTEFTFDAAHRLYNYPGACTNIHGHTYRVILELEFDEGGANKAPFFMDFKNFKGLLRKEIAKWDHSLILYSQDSLLKVLHRPFYDAKDKLVLIDLLTQPTAENMAYLLAVAARDNYAAYVPSKELIGWESLAGKDISCTLTVTVFETPKNSATVAVAYIGKGLT